MLARFYIVLVFLFAVFPHYGYAAKEVDYSKHEMNYDLPVNAAATPKVFLSVRAPKNYVAANKAIDAFIHSRTTMLEYVPKNETLDEWSSIMTIMLALNEKLQADSYTNNILDDIIASVDRAIVVVQNTENNENYKFSTVAIEYMPESGGTELMVMEYYSGPYDSAGVQYTKTLDHWLERKEAETVVEEMKQFIGQYVTASY